jgi:putative RecB family exonuclease
MAIYSHSRIQTFEVCPYKYKLQYIDRIKVEIPTTIEAFMGNQVHNALEKLYRHAMYQKTISKEDVLALYNEEWAKEFTPHILIVSTEHSAEDYRKRGELLLSHYYDHYFQKREFQTIALETQDRLRLDNGHYYHIRIDRLGRTPDGTYYVCDYKTNKTLKTHEEIETDRQLSMYAAWVYYRFPDVKEVKLYWYFLSFDTKLESLREPTQLKTIQDETEKKIDAIEQATDFPIQTSRLCHWCVYRSLCPAWAHLYEQKQKTIHTFASDADGTKLIDEYETLLLQKKEIEDQIKVKREEITAFAKHRSLTRVFGTDKKATLSHTKSYSIPTEENKTQITSILKTNELLEDYLTLNTAKVTKSIGQQTFPEHIRQQIEALVEKKENVRITISSRKEDEY